MSQTGKIARLPLEIREELNRRLADSESSTTLLRWLNDQPAVQAILTREFGGKPVGKQNLSHWRAHGFVEWQGRHDLLTQARKLAAAAPQSGHHTGETSEKWTDHLTNLVAVRYATAITGWDGQVNEPFLHKFRVLRSLCRQVVQLRRGDLNHARLKLDRERHHFEQEKNVEKATPSFEQWLKNIERPGLALYRADKP